MTFIDNSAEKPTPTFIILFSIIAFFYLLCALFTFHRSNTRRHYSRIYSIRILFPLACLSCLAENIAIAASGSIIDKKLSHHDLLKVIYVLQAFQVPIYLVVIFELTYLVHKRRSVHFCGMFFDEGRLGRRVKGVFSTPVKSFVFRNLIRFIALISLVVGCLANLDLLRDRDIKDELAGRTGWWKLWDTEGDRVWTVHILMSLVPTAILIFCSFFLSIALWRYVHFAYRILLLINYIVFVCWRNGVIHIHSFIIPHTNATLTFSSCTDTDPIHPWSCIHHMHVSTHGSSPCSAQ